MFLEAKPPPELAQLSQLNITSKFDINLPDRRIYYFIRYNLGLLWIIRGQLHFVLIPYIRKRRQIWMNARSLSCRYESVVVSFQFTFWKYTSTWKHLISFCLGHFSQGRFLTKKYSPRNSGWVSNFFQFDSRYIEDIWIDIWLFETF